MISESAPKPNLFLVGAMKCGTTSLYEYLRGHPQIFFPHTDDPTNYFRAKEPHYFAPDRHLPARVAIKTQADYLALYKGADGYRYRGDASASYLFSRDAPRLIKAFCPEARILMMLRPPVEMMHSKHRHMLGWIEDIPDFYEAVAASNDRRYGRRIPPGCDEDTWLDYIEPCRFAPQVERYLQAFGREAVKIVLLEDFTTEPDRTWQGIMNFLDIDNSHRPDFRVHNETARHGVLERMARSVYTRPAIHRVASRLIPYKVVRRTLSIIRHVDYRDTGNDAREQALHDACRPDVERLAQLIGRDLRHWIHPPAGGT